MPLLRPSIATGALLFVLACAPSNAIRGEDTQPSSSPAESRGAPEAPITGSAESPTVAGRWRVAETADEARGRGKAIDDATASLGRLKRGAARQRLREQTSPPADLEISLEGATASVQTNRRQLEAVLGADPKPVMLDGKEVEIGASLEGETLVVRANEADAGRITTYRLQEPGLLVEVTLTSRRLGSPIRFATSYTRVP